MKQFFSTLLQAVFTLIGLAIFIGLMWWAATANSQMWRLVATRYGRRGRRPIIARKIPETLIIAARNSAGGIAYGNLAYRLYGASAVAVRADGLELTQIPPFNVMCPPLFLPFDGMTVTETSWALWPQPIAVRMRQLPDLDIILRHETVRWIREHIDRTPFGLG